MLGLLPGLNLKTPVIAGSGPLCLDGEAMIRLYENGAGAVVTKNICLDAKKNPTHYMRQYAPETLINCERYLDYPGEQWLNEEIPMAAEAGVPVIVNVGMNTEQIAPYLDRLNTCGACAVECVSYRADWLVPMVAQLKKVLTIPLIVKLSPNYTNFIEVACACEELGADAFTCGDSKGPVQKIDIETGKPFCGGSDGHGWLSGAGLLPFAVHNVVELRRITKLPIIGMGGVTNWQAAIEMFMAGADAVSLCSVLVTDGMEAIGTIDAGIRDYLAQHGCRSLADIKGRVHRYLEPKDSTARPIIRIDHEKCTLCGRCQTSCVYDAIGMNEAGHLYVEEEKCSLCGVCSSLCPAVTETER